MYILLILLTVIITLLLCSVFVFSIKTLIKTLKTMKENKKKGVK